jgi:hypothetical protein
VLKLVPGRADTRVVDSNRDATAGVAGGILMIRPAEGSGRAAVIDAAEGIELVANGVVVDSPAAAAAAGEVEAFALDDPPSLTIRVEISRDAMVATANVERTPGARYRLEDQPQNRRITLRRRVVERLTCPQLTLAQIAAALAAEGVVFGIDRDAIGRLARGAFGPETVARGVAPIRPTHATLELAAVDGHGDERFVRAGTLLARMVDGEPGRDGMTVTGERTATGAPRPFPLELGEGVKELGDGRLVAASDGHARLLDGSLEVMAALLIEGDVRASSGDISSPGSVEVTGSVEDGVIRAKRHVLIGEQARRSQIETGGSLLVTGAVFESTIRVGQARIAVARSANAVEPLAREVWRVHHGTGQLLSASRASGTAMHQLRALTIVMERLAPGLEARIREVIGAVDAEHGTVPVDVIAALRGGYRTLEAVRSGRAGVEMLAQVAEVFEKQTAMLREIAEDLPIVQATLIERSDVDVVGHLAVIGRGVVESALRVAGRLEIARSDAIIRGGSLHLIGDAYVNELAPGPRGLVVTMAAGSTLEAALVQPDVVFELPDGAQRVVEPWRNVQLVAEPAAA